MDHFHITEPAPKGNILVRSIKGLGGIFSWTFGLFTGKK